MNILVIENNKNISDLICMAFDIGWENTNIVTAEAPEEGIELTSRIHPDTIIIDLGPTSSITVSTIKRLRLMTHAPIIVLGERCEETTIVRCFGAGADDYIFKPFGMMEIVVRVNTIMRRSKSSAIMPLID